MTTISLSPANLKSEYRRLFSRAGAWVFPLLLLCACTQPATVTISDAWIREAPPGAKHLAGYLVIENNLSSTITLTGVSSESFATAQIHQTTMDDGVARMRMIDELAIEPGRSQAFSPGGMHLMLMNPKANVVAGDTIVLVLHFAKQADLPLQVPVKVGL